jgi:hypothetical protein
MVKYSIGGPISRATGARLHSEIGETGEFIWAKIVGGEWVGSKRDPLYNNKSPPIDVIDYNTRIGYQVKIISDPNPHHKVSFSGAHKITKGTRIGGHPQYIGEPEDKLVKIRDYLSKKGLEGALIVMVLQEDTNRAVVYARRGVGNWSPSEMEAVGIVNNDTGEFVVPRLLEGGIEASGLPIPHHADSLPQFPDIPTFLRSSTKGDLAWHEMRVPGVRGMFRRVRVREHRRRA